MSWETWPGNRVRKRIRDWKSIYEEYFGLVPDFSKIIIPSHHPGDFPNRRLILVCEGIGAADVLRVCIDRFGLAIRSGFPDLSGLSECRSSLHGSYAVWACGGANPEAVIKELLTREVPLARQTASMTFTERLLFGILCRSGRCGRLLAPDELFGTLCLGSRLPGGLIPFVHSIAMGASADACRAEEVVWDVLRARQVAAA